MRWRLPSLIVILLALAPGCITRTRSRCLPSNCEGCCDGDQCIKLADQNHEVCGFLGSECRACTESQACRSGYCLSHNDGGGSIGPGECGFRGETCCPEGSGCVFGLYCVNGFCSNEPPSGSVDGGVGTGKAIGEACTADAECAYQVCAGPPFTGGYCSKPCQVAGECPTGTTCGLDPRDILGVSRMCLKVCTTSGTTGGACRAGYVCEARLTSVDRQPVCVPPCKEHYECGQGRCDSRGFCCGINGYACCEGTSCNDGGITCQSGYCRGAAGANATGSACTQDNNCAGGLCLGQIDAGLGGCFAEPCWPGGMCTQPCSVGSCAAGSTCTLERTPYGVPMCLPNCAVSGGQSTCRSGYVCDRGWALNSSQAVCMYRCGDAIECPLFTVCQDGFCCGAPSYRCCGGVGGSCESGGTCNAEGYCE